MYGVAISINIIGNVIHVIMIFMDHKIFSIIVYVGNKPIMFDID